MEGVHTSQGQKAAAGVKTFDNTQINRLTHKYPAIHIFYCAKAVGL